MHGIVALRNARGRAARGLDFLHQRLPVREQKAVDAPLHDQRNAAHLALDAHRYLASVALRIRLLKQKVPLQPLLHAVYAAVRAQIAALKIDLRKRSHVYGAHSLVHQSNICMMAHFRYRVSGLAGSTGWSCPCERISTRRTRFFASRAAVLIMSMNCCVDTCCEHEQLTR